MKLSRLPIHISKRFHTKEYRLAGREQSVAVDFDGKSGIELKAGHLARFASSTVVASFGDNAVMATVVQRKSKQGDGSGVPLQVEYRPSASAIGRIPTNFLRRELSQSDNEILISRAIDRSIRPLLPGNSYETQIICKPLALDENADQIMLGINAASTALQISSAAYNGPLAALRVARTARGDFHVNPTQEELREASLNLIVAMRKHEKTVMIELDGRESSAEHLEHALDVAFRHVAKLHEAMEQLTAEPKDELASEDFSGLERLLEETARERIYYVITDAGHDKISRDMEIKAIFEEICAEKAFQTCEKDAIYRTYSTLVKKVLRDTTLRTGIRCDGRRPDEFRPITIHVDMYKKLHGCSIFQRGQTQVMSTVTFDSPAAAFHPDSVAQLLGSQRKKSFMLHYEFPGFAINEFGTTRSLNRREIGHGALAEKSLKNLFPADFPYATRLACQVLESNGSSSMASVCGGSLALFDAGVPMKNAAAGVAIGLISDEAEPETKYRVLTDILGIEDYAGDMDFKVAGTRDGFTAAQLDVKNGGLTRRQLTESLQAARAGIDHVLQKMSVMRDRPREQFKPTVPIIQSMRIEPHKRVTLFRNNGYNCKLIEAETGVKISAEDEAHISLLAQDKEKLQKAMDMMNDVLESNSTLDFAFGSIVQAEIVEIIERGVYLTLPGSSRRIFMSNNHLSLNPVRHPDVLGLKIGDKMSVHWFGRDEHTGNIRLSRKTLAGAKTPATSQKKK
ncbi:polyribonucleotide nucleotidyltransferase [Caenorhabditis elegans]|uniref:polyribonucleotide nucleotidyltransferase n=1 Tax=Caenorhabditis elegans TaxID=6239 RepID=Q965N3_CAEEL|nr:polyribonucleotide nucleotidyltransferase [Caenorhabditis elegans]CCD62274.1 polyribonucleotide nucleotidyltransferase [Caenorhabditis elegans]|eukprot:NP_497324.3 Uncharacterized protein CELE_BE0003N10.1 [Caenorhabditis elegans]